MSLTDTLDVPRFDEPALCAETDPEAFCPEKGGSVRAAKALCGRCAVQDECLTYALDRRLVASWDGIWGGTTPRERRALLQEQSQQPEPAPAPVLALVGDRGQRGPRPWTTDEARAAIGTMTAAGFSASEIARELGISSRTVVRFRTKKREAAA